FSYAISGALPVKKIEDEKLGVCSRLESSCAADICDNISIRINRDVQQIAITIFNDTRALIALGVATDPYL
ncbi:MAG TPA: hypothetical protein VL854_11705, partial [Nitrososphaeraceae archaeon]|nr:hypothetical protein [Nitrososphaeraceae archaeon]